VSARGSAPVTSDRIRGFNRDTGWLATGVLGTVIFAALLLAVQEHHQTKVISTEEAVQAGSDLLLNARVVTPGSLVTKSTHGQASPGEGSDTDHAFDRTSPQDDPSSQKETAAMATAPALPPVNHNGAQPNPGSGSLIRRQNSARATGSKSQNARNRSWASGTIDVKRRLVELWHQSLARSEKTRSWAAFSNLKRGASKKAAYTAKTGP
jgi:hypothetical protein